MKTSKISLLAAFAAALSLSACDMDVPNLNGLDLDKLEETPTPGLINEASTGLLIGNRAGKAGGNGLVSILGIVGRESYNFDPADPRYRTEMLEADSLDGGSPAFGGNFWVGPYNNIRNGHIVLHALEVVSGVPAPDKNAVSGFAKTIMALDFLTLINTRHDNGIPIEVDRGVNDELAPIAPRAEVMTYILSLLDEGYQELMESSAAFPFPLHSGFAGFDTPATFMLFNRAVKARASIYSGDFQGAIDALEGSFLSMDPADLDLGVYYVYSAGTGDVLNGLSSPNLYAHPSIAAEAAMKGDGTLDDRVTRKLQDAPAKSAGSEMYMYTSDQQFTAYQSNTAPLPLIRNEELLLIRAEANIGLGNYPAALEDLNLVRTASGGLDPLADLDETNAIDALLYERRYSLLFEGGHRWIDVRRHNRLDDLLASDEAGNELKTHAAFPLPSDECNARGFSMNPADCHAP